MKNQAFEEVLANPIVVAIANAFEGEGVEIALVGGVVRDALCGRVSDDFDFTTNLRPDAIRERLKPLGSIWDAGARFGTIAVTFAGEKIEVTTYRSEQYNPDSRKPAVGFGDSLLEDLRRRDLTMNALALKLEVVDGRVRGTLVDPFGGAEDLRSGVLRTPSDPLKVMSDDPLRIIRAIRFSAIRDMRLDTSLQEAVGLVKDRLDIVAFERKLNELEKLIKDPRASARALRLSEQLGVKEALFGGLFCRDAAKALEELEGSRREVLTLLGSFAKDGEGEVRRLRMPGADARRMRSDLLLLSALKAELRPREARSLIRKYSDEDFESAFRVLAALGSLVEANKTLLEELRLKEPQLRAPLPVDGNDALELGLVGREIKLALARVEEELLQKGTLSREKALLLLRRN